LFYARIPGYVKDGHLGLRRLRIFDGPFIRDILMDRDILKSGGLSKPISKSWFFVWWWIKKTFEPAYCVEFDSKRIGFIGLYDLKLGKSAEMTLVIYEKNCRRMGYGTRTFHILAQALRRYNLIEKIVVKVREDNHASISFWTGLGFEDVHSLGGIRVMSLDIKGFGSDLKQSRQVVRLLGKPIYRDDADRELFLDVFHLDRLITIRCQHTEFTAALGHHKATRSRLCWNGELDYIKFRLPRCCSLSEIQENINDVAHT